MKLDVNKLFTEQELNSQMRNLHEDSIEKFRAIAESYGRDSFEVLSGETSWDKSLSQHLHGLKEHIGCSASAQQITGYPFGPQILSQKISECSWQDQESFGQMTHGFGDCWYDYPNADYTVRSDHKCYKRFIERLGVGNESLLHCLKINDHEKEIARNTTRLWFTPRELEETMDRQTAEVRQRFGELAFTKGYYSTALTCSGPRNSYLTFVETHYAWDTKLTWCLYVLQLPCHGHYLYNRGRITIAALSSS